jgi:hypothetical protein
MDPELGKAIRLEDAIEILLEVWEAVPFDEIFDAWKRLWDVASLCVFSIHRISVGNTRFGLMF